MLTNSNIHSSVATNSKLPTSIINLPNNLKNHQLLGNSNHTNGLINSNIQSHPIPPRYQPPPQPSGGNPPNGNSNGQISGGILKNFGLKQPVSYYHQSSDIHHSATGNHINLKYPPEIPKLTNIYLPDSLKNSNGGSGVNNNSNNNNNNNQSRLIPPRAGGNNISGTNTVNNLRLSSSGIHPPSRVNQQQQTVQIHQQPQRIQSEEAEFVQRQPQTSQEMLKFVRKCETESTQTGGTTVPQNTQNNVGVPIGRLTAEQNRHFQSLISELRALKEANQRLSDDNQELRDLCCFLDDDRQKGRKLAREWQRFGRYTASVMRQEVSAYQSKLRQLDDKQQELIRDNLELKELCLYLDEERANALSSNNPCQACGTTVSVANAASHLRDDGDGSSSSTNADEPMPNIRHIERNNITELNLRPTLNDQTLQYVRSLEQRILQLEEEQTTNGSTMNPTHEQNTNDPISGRPEAVVRALQVLEVREQLERDRIGGMPTQSTEQIMDDGEKALVREMCNVVWRKLEDNTNGPGGIDQI